MNSTFNFEYQGCHFMCIAVKKDNSLYLPRVVYQFGVPGHPQGPLPIDTEPYATEAEAIRHAQQQAVRWVHDMQGDGQGQF